MKVKYTYLNRYLFRLFVVVLVSISQLAYAQEEIKVSGVVKDETGNTLPGASIKIAGSDKGVVTDTQGQFKIDVKDGATLSISFIGMATKTIVVNKNNTRLTITLSENGKQLNEVVVVGYGTQKKSDVTGSVTSVPKSRLTDLPVSNVMQSLEGAVAGLAVSTPSSIPGSQPTVTLRGQNSITAASSPYVVVDGIPLSKTGGSLNDINPNDIASIEILKDPSAVAIYGTNGSNGVILVTTKRGGIGKPVISYNGSVGFDNISHMLDPRDGPSYVQKYADYIAETGQTFTSPVPNNSELVNLKAGQTVDWIKQITQQGYYQDHNINVSGGSPDVKYFISGDYLSQKGVLKGYQYQRVSFRSNIDANITSFLTIGANLYYANNNYDGGRANLQMAAAMSPYGNEYNADGTYAIYPMYPELLYTNPLLALTTTALRRTNDLSGNGYAEVNFDGLVKGLKYRLNVGYNYVPGRVDTYAGRLDNVPLGAASLTNTEYNTYTLDNILTYNRDFGKNHFDITGLYSQQERSYLYSNASATGFVNDVLTFYNLGAGATQTSASSAYRSALRSEMGRLNYSYNSRYLFTFTVRRDGSSVFGANTDKYGWFPVAAVGWNIGNENFLKDSKVVSSLKLRASYGTTGNEAINPYQTITTDGTVRYPFNGTAYIGALASSTLGNGDLHWETKTGTNIGTDFSLFSSRINGTIDAYNATTSGLILSRSLPAISGYSNVYDNIGKIGNKGIEVSLNTRNIVQKDFKWETTIVFATNQNKIIDLYGNGQSDLGNRWFIGSPISVIYDYKMTGIWQNGEDASKQDPGAKPGDLKFADTDGDGKITANDRVILGQTDPKWTGGLTNTFHYKSFNLNVFIQTAQGMMRYNNDLNTTEAEGRANTAAAIGYWTPTNGNNEFQSLSYTNTRGYGYPQNASYTRIKDVTLSYVVPARYLEKAHISGLTIYASGRNLYTFTKWIGMDPEMTYYSRGSGNSGANQDAYSSDSTNNYPPTRTIVIGANISLK